ncbi:MlaA family lipoprotein [Pseudorhodoferax soli]|uniref:Phospholipid-binding lipoprotein MlaA n=1 Tax=Pseudorhodoferax soli TaxID=545864 RepID=A0A368Y454_9BURK|nr:VacJ family lipoprotein [Pseudorhodoferax soli]RCW74126.1 phospholipid-binding lipoprotein MlaA [Pseudorhodoferax soli]
MKFSFVRPRAAMAGVLVLALLGGCATGPNADPRDPLEPFNRGVYSFNEGVDRAVLKPVAQAYNDTLPSPVRTGVRNFFNNLADAWTAVNALLQLRGQAAVESLFRFQVNTVFGLGGLIDIASDADIPRHREDFGKTLGRWGVPTGPYLVLPLLGPSTIRDTAALPVDTWGNPVSHLDDHGARYGLYGLRIIDARAQLLRASSVLDEAALDKYSFTRDVYLQWRGASDYDGQADDPSARPVPAPAQ